MLLVGCCINIMSSSNITITTTSHVHIHHHPNSKEKAAHPQSKSMWSKLPLYRFNRYLLHVSHVVGFVAALSDQECRSYPPVPTWDDCIGLCLCSCVHLIFSIWHSNDLTSSRRIQPPASIYIVEWKHKVRLESNYSIDKTFGAGPVISSVTMAHHKRWAAAASRAS